MEPHSITPIPWTDVQDKFRAYISVSAGALDMNEADSPIDRLASIEKARDMATVPSPV
jgi:hypothetical protein